MRHGTLRILCGYGVKRVFGVGIGEGVKEGDASVELILDGGCAGDRKRYFSKFLGRAVVVCLLCG
jgi:hypothetical protein